MKHPFPWLVLLIFLANTPVCLRAQVHPEPITMGEKWVLPSGVLDEERPVMVYTPKGYEDSLRTFPVLYLLDGAGNFHHTTACVRFLAKNQKIPEMIVVGIPNTKDRTRDLTPPYHSDNKPFPTAGGADTMLSFIEKELMPFIADRYRINDYKLLVGHSFGGLFAIHTLLHYGDLFNAYLAISPSLWWDNQHMLGESLNRFLLSQVRMQGHLYITMGNERKSMLGGVWKLIAALEEKGPKGLRWHFEHMPEETHGSIPHLSTYEGLEFIFSEWDVANSEELFAAAGADAIRDFEENVQSLYGFPHLVSEYHLHRLGRESIEEHKIEKAIDILSIGVDHYPDSWKIRTLLGTAYEMTGAMESAAIHLKKGLELNPKDKQAMVTLRRMGEDVSEYIPDIRLSSEELHSYAGKYRADDEQVYDVVIDEQTLRLSNAGSPQKLRLTPIGKHTFYVELQEAELTFQMENGKATGFYVKYRGGGFSAKRVE